MNNLSYRKHVNWFSANFRGFSSSIDQLSIDDGLDDDNEDVSDSDIEGNSTWVYIDPPFISNLY